ncbi:MAG TPA: hypothetical protein VL137_09320, partial [Polyangiaceae bacterium]|nr:hypothetical protein [Polyangiaceae bacterium]
MKSLTRLPAFRVARRAATQALTSLTAGLLAIACGGKSASAPAPVVEPKLTLVSVSGAGATGWQVGGSEACVELGHDAHKTVLAQVRIDGDWLLRPLHNCDNRIRCGFVQIQVSTADGRVLMTKSAASLAVDLPFADISPAVGSYTFSARLLDQFGAPYVAPEGHASPCGDGSRCTASLTTQLTSCGGPVIPVPDASTPAGPTNDAAVPPTDAAVSDAGALMDATISDASMIDASPASDATIADAAIV